MLPLEGRYRRRAGQSREGDVLAFFYSDFFIVMQEMGVFLLLSFVL